MTTASTSFKSLRGPTSRAQRLRRITDLLHITPEVTVHELAAALGVHPATVRTDVTHLESRGLVQRDHGTLKVLSPALSAEAPEPPGRLSFSQRRDRILSLLAEHGPLSVACLAKHFDVHEITLRRDLDQLRGDLVTFDEGRVHLQTPVRDLPCTLRRDLLIQAKEHLAQRALTFVEDGMTVGLDASTTCLALARHLRSRHVTVLTSGLDTAEALLSGTAKIRIPGGTLHPASRSMHDLTEVLPLLDVVFFSCAALAPGGQFEDTHPEEAMVKRHLLSAARQRVALMDHTKLGRRAAHEVIRIEALDSVLLDRAPRDDVSAQWPDLCIEVAEP